jgi:hypothetical protein
MDHGPWTVGHGWSQSAASVVGFSAAVEQAVLEGGGSRGGRTVAAVALPLPLSPHCLSDWQRPWLYSSTMYGSTPQGRPQPSPNPFRCNLPSHPIPSHPTPPHLISSQHHPLSPLFFTTLIWRSPNSCRSPMWRACHRPPLNFSRVLSDPKSAPVKIRAFAPSRLQPPPSTLPIAA